MLVSFHIPDETGEFVVTAEVDSAYFELILLSGAMLVDEKAYGTDAYAFSITTNPDELRAHITLVEIETTKEETETENV